MGDISLTRRQSLYYRIQSEKTSLDSTKHVGDTRLAQAERVIISLLGVDCRDTFYVVSCKILLYRVMQSDGDYFCGDAFLIIVNMAFRNEDSILEQIYIKKQICSYFYKGVFFKHYIKMHTDIRVHF